MERILLVEDDSAIYQPLTSFLRGEGFAVRQASGQREALALLETEEFDLVLLDVGLRDGNGFSVCSAVKQRGGTAVIFLSASGDEYSVVTGLDLGADDYIAKPFRPRELVSRIRSVLRRTGRAQSVLDVGPLRVDTERACVSKNGQELSLSALEYRLLLVFLNHRGATLSRALINAPSVVLADEPTGNLDRKNSQEIVELLKYSNRQYGQTLIVITHDESIALQADRVLAIEDGHIVRDEVIRK